MELSYSLHLGNDKNKSIKARQEAKNTPSGTTSKNNKDRKSTRLNSSHIATSRMPSSA